MISTVSFVVAGVPIPQGSSRAFVVKGKAVITSSNRNLAQWRQRIATEAQKVAQESLFYEEDGNAYQVCAQFYFPRTKAMGKKEIAHTVRPDIDKLIRAVNDGITGILIPDDARIDQLTVKKTYLKFDAVYGPRVEISITKRRKLLDYIIEPIMAR